jgi:hypothetical protein
VNAACKETDELIRRIPEAKVLEACRTLFGSDVSVGRDFLSYLRPSGAKSAFRKIAKETHPDLFAGEHAKIQQQRTELFREVRQAYEILTAFFKQRDEGLWMPTDSFSVRDLRKKARRAATNGDRYYEGPVPLRLLEIGLYLYYRGSIPYRALIEALVWQRGQRPVLGTIAKRWNWLDDEDLRAILSLRGRPLRFGEKAVHLGLLTPFHVKALLWYQRSQQERLGQFFIQRDYLASQELERMVEDLHCHNTRVIGRGNGHGNRN